MGASLQLNLPRPLVHQGLGVSLDDDGKYTNARTVAKVRVAIYRGGERFSGEDIHGVVRAAGKTLYVSTLLQGDGGGVGGEDGGEDSDGKGGSAVGASHRGILSEETRERNCVQRKEVAGGGAGQARLPTID